MWQSPSGVGGGTGGGGGSPGDSGIAAATDVRVTLTSGATAYSFVSADVLKVSFHVDNPKNRVVLLQALADSPANETVSVLTDPPSSTDAQIDGVISISTTRATAISFHVNLDGVSLAPTSSVSFAVDYSPTAPIKTSPPLVIGEGASPKLTGLAFDAAGNTFVTGSFSGSLSLGNGVTLTSQGGTDGFLAKFAASGSVVWAKALSGAGADVLSSLAVDASGNIAVVGAFGLPSASLGSTPLSSTAMTGDGRAGVLASFDSAGTIRWANVLTPEPSFSPTVQFNQVAVAPTGAVVVGGTLNGTLKFGGKTFAANTAGFAAQVSKDGVAGWLVLFAGASPGAFAASTVTTVLVDSGGNTYAAGNFTESFTLAGTTKALDAKLNQAFVAKLGATGNPVWVEGAGAPVPSLGSALHAVWLALTPSNDLLAAGLVSGNEVGHFGAHTLASAGYEQLFVARYSGSSWAWVHGTPSAGIVVGGVAASTTGFSVAGSFGPGSLMVAGQTRAPKGRDGFVAGFDQSGIAMSLQTFGAAGDEVVSAFGARATGELLLAGTVSGAIDLTGGQKTSNSATAGVVLSVGSLP